MDQYNPEVVNFLKYLSGRFKFVTGFQFGVDDAVHPYLATNLVLLKTVCRNTEYFHRVKLSRPNVEYVHYLNDRDIREWFTYFPWKYDLGVVNAGNFDTTNIVFSELLARNTPIVIVQNLTRAFTQIRAPYLFERVEADGEVFGIYYLDIISKRGLLE
jgi:hypothetical protein